MQNNWTSWGQTQELVGQSVLAKMSHESFEEAKKLPEWRNMDKDMAEGMVKIMGAIAATNAAKAK